MFFLNLYILNEHLSVKLKTYCHKELAPGRIKKDAAVAEHVIEVMESMFQNPWSGVELTSLSTGLYCRYFQKH